MAIYSAVLDACVLVPMSVADTLLRTAEKRLFRPIWSSEILDETAFAIQRVHPDLDPKLIERRIWHMNETFPGAMVENLEHIEEGLSLPDPGDNHVLAAALRGQCDAIVTANLKHFPAEYLDSFGIETISPDDFLLNQLDLDNRALIDCIREQATATKNPPLTIEDLLTRLGNAGVPNFADEVYRRIR